MITQNINAFRIFYRKMLSDTTEVAYMSRVENGNTQSLSVVIQDIDKWYTGDFFGQYRHPYFSFLFVQGHAYFESHMDYHSAVQWTKTIGSTTYDGLRLDRWIR